MADLCQSHIFPDFFIRSLERKQVTGRHGEALPFSIGKSTNPDEGDGPRQRGYWEKKFGLKERLLCTSCEKQFNGYETYTRELLYGTTPSPLKKILLGVSLTGGTGVGLLIDRRRVAGVDYTRLKLFQLSLLWRASIASGRFFRNVSLGDKHEPEVRRLLLAGDPGKELAYACVMIDLRHKGLGWEDCIPQPSAERDSETNQRIYKIIVGGYMYVFHVSNMPPPRVTADACVKQSGVMVIPVAKAEKIMKSWGAVLRAARKL